MHSWLIRCIFSSEAFIFNFNKHCMFEHTISQFGRNFNILRADFGLLHQEIQCKLFITCWFRFYGVPLWNICSNTSQKLCDGWWKCLRTIWRVHRMTHCDVITLVSHCKPMEICIQHRFCKYVANIFQNGVLVWELLFGLPLIIC